jgi:hypothetical protein
MLASTPSQHLESEFRSLGNPPFDSYFKLDALVRAYYKIREPRVRKRLFEAVKALGAASHAEALSGKKRKAKGN